MPDAPFPSRRAHVRNKTLKEAKVVLSDWSSIDCLVRNLSEGGARLEFGDPTPLPQHFFVLIKSTNMLIPAQRTWLHGAVAGVEFTGPPRPAPARKF